MHRQSLMSVSLTKIMTAANYKKRFLDEDIWHKYFKRGARENCRVFSLKGQRFLKSEISENIRHGVQCFNFKTPTADNGHIIYLHGGAYFSQPVFQQFEFVDKIVNAAGLSATLPIYPKVPHACYRESYSMLLKLYNELLPKYGENIHIIGDSAGGGLALGFAQYLRENNLPQPKNIIMLSPWLDVTLVNPKIRPLQGQDPLLGVWGLQRLGLMWAGGDNPKDYRVSPIYGDFSDLGKMTLFTGTREILLADSRLLKKKVNETEIKMNYYEYPELYHDFPLYPIPEAKDAIAKIISILSQEAAV